MMNLCKFNVYIRFFGPTICSLRNERVIHLLCLSNGNAVGQGKVREKELTNATNYLKIKHLKILDNPKLQDSMTNMWDKEVVGEEVLAYLKENPEIKTVSIKTNIDFNI